MLHTTIWLRLRPLGDDEWTEASLSIDGGHFPPLGGTISVGKDRFTIEDVDWHVELDAIHVRLKNYESESEKIDRLRRDLQGGGWEMRELTPGLA